MKYILAITLIFSIPAYAENKNIIGATYPIIEKNILATIQRRAKQIDLLKQYKNRQDFSSSVHLKRVKKGESKKRIINPVYKLPFEVRIPNKGLLYPKNYAFNPLKYFSLPSSIVIVEDEKDFQRIKKHPLIKPNPMYISLSNPLDMNKNRTDSEHFFMLTKEMAKRLKIEKVPSIINQVGEMLEIQEIYLEDEK